MARLANKKLDGSTLIEVLIAMVIIMIVFAIALKVFSNVLSSGVNFTSVAVQNQLNALANEVKNEGYLQSEVVEIDSIAYKCQVNPTETDQIGKLEIIATRNGKYIGGMKCLFKIKEKHED